jgi:hypothetical protein
MTAEPFDPEAAKAEARAKLDELRALSARILEIAEAARAGEQASKEDIRIANRAAALARYVVDCCNRASYNPPPQKKRRQAGWGFAWAMDNSERAPEPSAEPDAIREHAGRVISPANPDPAFAHHPSVTEQERENRGGEAKRASPPGKSRPR